MRFVRNASLVLVLLVVGAGVWLFYELNNRPSLEPYDALALAPAQRQSGLRVRFMGVSTLLFEDGDTAILIDGFFTRSSLLTLLAGRLQPDAALIASSLERVGAERIAAVIAVHSHYDHVMDSPEVARRTGALLVGSESTANVGRGWGLPEERIRVVTGGETMSFGRFNVTLYRSRHAPIATADGETINAPLTPPARATQYREGGSYSVLIEHEGRAVLVQGSAGFVEGALRDAKADVVYLGVGGAGRLGEEYLADYWRETVTATGARRVIPIHWDDFTRPLSQPLVPFPYLIDDLDNTMRFLLGRGREEGVEVRWTPVWEAVDPFVGLD